MDQDKTDIFLLCAHELRTSLSAMKWLFKMLSDGDYGVLTPEQRAAIDQASTSNDRMVSLINDTMNTIKSDGVMPYNKLPVHLPTLIAETVKEFTGEAGAKHITLNYHQSADLATVVGDEAKLRIAFHNIVENAIKYSSPDTEILISVTNDGAHSIVQVQDHGIGVPREEAGHLFERFFRAHNSGTEGTGLGLYSSKLIVEHHGGTITMISTEGQGSTVTVTLPLQA